MQLLSHLLLLFSKVQWLEIDIYQTAYYSSRRTSPSAPAALFDVVVLHNF